MFNAIGIPACIWRRTGEICKVNSEFASLIDFPIETFNTTSDNAMCIYHIMTEESTVDYWEKERDGGPRSSFSVNNTRHKSK